MERRTDVKTDEERSGGEPGRKREKLEGGPEVTPAVCYRC